MLTRLIKSLKKWWTARWFGMSDEEALYRIERLLTATFSHDILALNKLVAYDFGEVGPVPGQLTGRLGYLQHAAWLSSRGIYKVRPKFGEMTVRRKSSRSFRVLFELEIAGLQPGEPHYDLDRPYDWILTFDRSHKLIERECIFNRPQETSSRLYPRSLSQDGHKYLFGWNAALHLGRRLAGILHRLRALLVTLIILYALLVLPPQMAEVFRLVIEGNSYLFLRTFGLPLVGLSVLMLVYGLSFVRVQKRFDLAGEPISTLDAFAEAAVCVILAALPYLIVVRALWVAWPRPIGSDPLFVTMAGTGLTLALFAGGFLIGSLRRINAVLEKAASAKRSLPSRLVRTNLAICSAIVFCVYLLPFEHLRSVPASLVTWTALALCLLGWLAWGTARTGVPLLLVAFGWPLLLTYLNLPVHNIVRSRPMPARSDAAQAPPPAGVQFESWLTRRAALPGAASPASTQPFNVFIVSAEGGGMRAAVMTDMVLDEIRARYPAFPHHLFAIIGVSGGAIGAASYAAALHEGKPARHAVDSLTDDSGNWQAALHADLLSPTVRAMLGPNLLANYVPGVDLSRFDRARALEDAWADGWQRATQDDALRKLWFHDVAPSPDSDQPNLILLTTGVADGSPMAVSHLGCFGIATAWDVAPETDFPLRTAAVMSARFPLITPSARLPGTNLPTAFVDGGYFENSGLTAVSKLLKAIEPPGVVVQDAECCSGAVPRVSPAIAPVRLVIIRISNGGARQEMIEDASQHNLLERLAPTPLATLYASGDAHGREAAATLADLSRQINSACARTEQDLETAGLTTTSKDKKDKADRSTPSRQNACYPVETVQFALSDSKVPIPLGWLLSSRARAEIARQIGGDQNTKAIEKVGALVR